MVLGYVLLEHRSPPNSTSVEGREAKHGAPVHPVLLDVGSKFLSQCDSLVLLSEKTLRVMSTASTKETHWGLRLSSHTLGVSSGAQGWSFLSLSISFTVQYPEFQFVFFPVFVYVQLGCQNKVP